MRISPFWNQTVQRSHLCKTTYRKLFRVETELWLCPFDGIHLVTNAELSDQFRELLDRHGEWRPFSKFKSKKTGYRECLELGCITVFENPYFPNTSKYKVVINPSTAGMSIGQLHRWIRFMVDNPRELMISKIDSKVDLYGVYPHDLFDNVWVPSVKKTNAQYKSDGTMYYGSPRSDWELSIYDKSKERGMNTVWSRMEVHEWFREKQKREDVLSFLSNLKRFQPFKEVYVVENDQIFHSACAKWGVDASLDSVQECLKSLTAYQKKHVLSVLQVNGKIHSLQHEFELQLKRWLKVSYISRKTPEKRKRSNANYPNKPWPNSVCNRAYSVVPQWYYRQWKQVIMSGSLADAGRSPPHILRIPIVLTQNLYNGFNRKLSCKYPRAPRMTCLDGTPP